MHDSGDQAGSGLLTSADDDHEKAGVREAFRGIYHASVPFFTSRDTWLRAVVLAAGCIVIVCGSPKVNIWAAKLIGQLSQSLAEGADGQESYESLKWPLVLYVFSSVATRLLEKLCKCMFALEWRKFLTHRLLQKYMKGHSFYTLQLEDPTEDIDNPDQRIAQDVASFTSTAVEMLTTFSGVAATILLTSVEILKIHRNLFCIVVGYAVAFDLIVFRIFGGRLMRLSSNMLGKEATLRFSLIRIRENAEAIAFYKGSQCELEHCEANFRSVVRLCYRYLFLNSIWQGIYSGNGTFSYILPFIILAPRVFSGAMEFGDAVQAQVLCTNLVGSILGIVGELENLSTVAAHSARVQRLDDELERIHWLEREQSVASDSSGSGSEGAHELTPLSRRTGSRRPDSDSDSDEDGAQPNLFRVITHSEDLRDNKVLRMDGVTVTTPAKDILVYDLSLELGTGDSLLIVGESGSGKSSLMRAIAGLWMRGLGSIQSCADSCCFFLSQSTYIVQGSLWDNVTYPKSKKPDECDPNEAFSQTEALEALEAVDLAYLVDKYGLHQHVNLEVLSGGEKQRLVFARALMRPYLKLIMLDEATSAIGVEHEDRLYSEMRRRGLKTYISVGHRASLDKFHTHRLCLCRYAHRFECNAEVCDLGDPESRRGQASPIVEEQASGSSGGSRVVVAPGVDLGAHAQSQLQAAAQLCTRPALPPHRRSSPRVSGT